MSTLPESRQPQLALPPADATAEAWDEWSSAIPHDCEPEEARLAARQPRGEGRRRLVGIDAARGLALLGMMAVHIVDAVAPDGTMSLSWRVSAGTSSALFAILAGIALSFMSGRTEVPDLHTWWRSGSRLALRGVLIIILGLALGQIVDPDSAHVILPYLGLLFILVLPALLLRPPVVFALAALGLVLAPVLSQLLRAGTGDLQPWNIEIGDLLGRPSDVVTYLLLTGLYPALTWAPYLLVGIALGRLDLQARRHVLNITVVGALLWLVTTAVSRVALQNGGLEGIATAESGRLTLSELTDLLVWGGDGTAPATTWWWFASAAPHTGLPLDLMRTTGVALLTLGLCMAVSTIGAWMVRPLAAPGSMTLTLYTAHLLLLGVLGDLPPRVHLLVQVVLLVGFALIWSRFFSRGPLEWALWRCTRWVARG